MRPTHVIWTAILLLSACAGPQTALQPGTPPTLTQSVYDQETADAGIPPTNAIRITQMEGPTPTRIEGAQTITTVALHDMMQAAAAPLLIDVLGGQQTTSLPRALWIPGAGLGRSLQDNLQPRLGKTLASLTNGDLSRPIVFFCLSRSCWLSHNAAVRAVALGYNHVYWYRGGRNAWQNAGLPMASVRPTTL